jgi:hypothetical protein
VNAAGRTIAAFPAATTDTAGATAEREILRSQLVELLFERTRTHADCRFGAQIRSVRDETDGVAPSACDRTTSVGSG